MHLELNLRKHMIDNFIKNDPLRLILSGEEREYLDRKCRRTGRNSVILFVLTALSAIYSIPTLITYVPTNEMMYSFIPIVNINFDAPLSASSIILLITIFFAALISPLFLIASIRQFYFWCKCRKQKKNLFVFLKKFNRL